MTGKIFLNYRRTDAEAWADRLFERLIQTFPRENVFLDIDGDIPFGFPWASWLDQQVSQCDLMIVLVGRTWVDEFKARSAPDERDFVRVEIESALARKIPVVPVFLGDAAVPATADLPQSIRPLMALQAARLGRTSFDIDSGKLVAGIGRSIELARGKTVNSGRDTQPATQSRPRQPGGIIHDAPPAPAPSRQGLVSLDVCRAEPGTGKVRWFKDIDIGPEMVVVPGSPPFAIGRFAVTFAEWDAAQAHHDWQRHAAIAPRKPNDAGWGRGKQPVIDVSWNDAKAYCAWLTAVTGKTYRLPSEAEWEQAYRAGNKTKFWSGNEISTAQANYDGNYTFGNGKKGEYRQRTMPVDSFEPNPWGLYQVHGNVVEWCEDAYDSSSRVVRGGSWDNNPAVLRSSYRYRYVPDFRIYILGFRVARVLSPARTL